ncbi:Tripartite-type tricarboxylate transporter, receptor component TctC [Fulvimarina manganoxydans]|uniref:Tripartite-type tricarboxylate transporter, receptor component TctC n=1 Tax=Fulvimarina manganoxydans TaxID=937218 RepID=A0A1W1ZDQ1_9HYPH|nr:tripartite tricarboxylate transporter substrate binding protein [Fulvimarina manganoxydans]MCK5932741.1 tripartite tricarboxylate transporter substrate binding protein [Fulvimarina manganoxydans]MEE2950463.1 tripartite tricarboxylate transporter substrate binding protein [Pseudomonadota bacterium]SMC46486.1 Tripartite-type tricarboxylate transporter, receptor component TctC [Fulvimarina manganoxydans]
MKTAPIALALAMTLVGGIAQAQTVEMIVPFSAGGGTDTVARVFEPGFAEALGRTVIIRNVDGASGTIGAAAAADASADGLTVGYLPIGPLAIQPSLRDTSYDADSFDYICQTTSTPVFLLQKKGGDAASVEDWVTRGQDGRVVYGSSGPGTIPHLAMAALSSAAGLNAVHLPFAGTGPAMNAMAGGEIDLFVDTATVLENNDVEALAVFAPERLEAYPDVPTMTEAGYALDFSVWQGLVAPKGMEPATLASYSDACKAAIETDRFEELAEKTNTGILYRGPEDFAAFVSKNAEQNRAILKEAGLTE